MHSRFFSSARAQIGGVLLLAILFIFVWQISPIGVSESASVFSCADISGGTDIRKPNSALATNAKDLFRENNKSAKNRGGSFSALVKGDQKTLVARKQHLVDLMRNDPDAAAKELAATTPKNLSTPTLGARNCVEQQTTEEGEVRILHADYLDNTTADLYTIKNTAGETLALHLPEKFAELIHISGEKIRVIGNRLGNDIVPDISKDDGVSVLHGKVSLLDFFKDFVKTAYASIASSMGPQKTLVIMANFNNTVQPAVTQTTVNNVVFSQVNDFYLHTSYNKTSITGTSINWVKLPINATCDYAQVMNSAVAAVDSTVDFRTYQNVMVIAPFSCGWAGLAYIGKLSLNTADGVVNVGEEWIQSGSVDRRVVGHELGHTLGAHHAGFLNCGTSTVPANLSGTGCSVVEYGDIYNVMGTSWGEMNAPHRDYIGWFDPLNVKNVTLSGTYVIEPLETQTLGLKTLRIPRSVNGFDDLYIEYRQPLGYDVGLSANVYSGASLHAIGPFKPQLLDTTPPGNASTPALLPGQTFVDPISGTSISVTNANASGLTVNVTLGKTDFTPPVVTSVNPGNNTVVKGIVSITVGATDPSGIGKVEFYDQGATVPFATDTIAPFTASWNSASVPDGTRNLSVSVYDKSGDPFGAANNIRRSFLSLIVYNNTDITAPTIKIFSPSTGSDVSSPVSINAFASDNVGVIRTELWKDADTSPITSSTNGNISISTPMSGGTHSIYAKAFDPAGNGTTSPLISFFVDTIPPTVSFTSPLNGSTVLINSTSTVTATASDNRSISQVQFVGTTAGRVTSVFFCSDTTPPYSCAWAVPSSVGVSYTIKATAYDKAFNSAISTLTVTSINNGSPAITTQPTSQSVISGVAATFSVVANGTAPLSYQWRKNGVDIAGATAASYTTPTTVMSDNGAVYSVVVSNTAGSVTSANATLTVKGLIGYWKFDETSGLVAADSSGFGHTGTLKGTASWTPNGKIAGAVSLPQAADMILASPVVSLPSSWTIGAWFTAPLPPTGTWHTLTRALNDDHQIITNSSLILGMYDNLTKSGFRTSGFNMGTLTAGWHHVTAVGSGVATTFYVDGVMVGTSDKKSSTNIYALGNYQGGTQRFSDKIDEVRIYNYALSAAEISALGAVAVGSPAITTQPISQSVASGATATFSVVANGTAPLSYQWRKNGVDIVGATAASYTTPTTVMSDNGAVYSVVVSNTAGSVTSANATLTVKGLIGYWKFDETSGLVAADSSGFGHTGTLVNGPVWAVGKVGQALSFDGVDDRADVVKNSSLDLVNTFTVSAWVYGRDPMTANRASVYSTRRTNPAGSWQLEVGGNMGSIGTIDNSFGITGVNTWVAVASANSILPNQWNHIAAVKNGTASADTKLYINGSEAGYSERNAYTGINNASNPLIGAGTNLTQFFNGVIDEVRVYNHALSPAEISALANVVGSPADGSVSLSKNFIGNQMGAALLSKPKSRPIRRSERKTQKTIRTILQR